MKIQHFLYSICLFSLLFLAGTRLEAQEAPTPFQASPVVPANVVDTILGKAYRVHTVQKGHTLYSICRAYQTSADSILKDSPDNQVQIDEFIYIPLRLLPGEDPKDFVRFTGKRPWAVVFLQKDEIVQVVVPPAEEKPAVNTEATENTVSEADTVAASPIAMADSTTSKKRRNRKEDRIAEPDTLLAAADTLEILLPDSVFATPYPQEKAYKDSLRVSLLLPLYSNTPQDKKAYIYLPFFEGASVAWQEFIDPLFFTPPVPDTVFDLEQDSLIVLPPAEPAPDTAKPYIQLKVYDLTQSANSLEEIINDSIFRLSDAVLATAFIDQFEILDSLSKEWQMPIIHPLSERDSMGMGNPYFIQLAASYRTQIDHIADFIKQHHAHAHILILCDSSVAETRKAEYLQSLLPQSEIFYFNTATVEMLEALGENNKKTVIVPFYRQEITAVKTMLPLRQTKGNITIIAPNVWLDYASIDLDYYLQNNLTVYHTFCNDVQTTDLLAFSRKYYFLYHALPNPLAYQGYTTMGWLLEQLSTHNADFMRHLDEQLYEREMGGFENKELHFVRVTENGLKHYNQ